MKTTSPTPSIPSIDETISNMMEKYDGITFGDIMGTVYRDFTIDYDIDPESFIAAIEIAAKDAYEMFHKKANTQ